MQNQRMLTVTQMDPFVGKYFSIEYVRRNVLQQKDKEYKEIEQQMNKEIELGMVMSPSDINTFDTLDRQNDAFAPEIDAQNAEDDQKRDLEMAKQQEKLKPAPTKTTSNTK